MRTAALVVFLLALCAGRTSAQQGPPSEAGAFLNWALSVRIEDRGWYAFTTCGNEPETWSNNERIPPDYVGMVRQHEAQHRADMEAKGSCYAWHLWHHGNRAADIETEARAFCAGARWDAANGYGWVAAIMRGAAMFAGYYADDPAWGLQAATDAIHAHCR